MRYFLSLLVILSVGAEANAEEGELVSVACRATWHFEKATSDIQGAMLRSVGTSCANDQQQPTWLCDGRPLTYYSELIESDVNTTSGLVCFAEAMNKPRYESHEIEATSCMVAEVDEDSGEYELSILVAASEEDAADDAGKPTPFP